MNNFTFYRKNMTALPTDLLLDPTISIEAKALPNEKITLLSHGGRICISGKSLFISVYENSNVEIVGKVGEIVFGYGKN